MLQLYYKIWVSVFLKIKHAQGGNVKWSLFYSLIVLSMTNFMNYGFVCVVSIAIFHTDINILFDSYATHRYLTVILSFLIFLLPNYFLIVFNKRYEYLLERYEKDNSVNPGVYYYTISALLFILGLLLTVLFTDYPGLK